MHKLVMGPYFPVVIPVVVCPSCIDACSLLPAAPGGRTGPAAIPLRRPQVLYTVRHNAHAAVARGSLWWASPPPSLL